MLDAAIGSIESERLDDARQVLAAALERHRETIRSLRDLSFNIEPVVLRDQGFRCCRSRLRRPDRAFEPDPGRPRPRRSRAVGGEGAGRALPDHPRGGQPGDPPRAPTRISIRVAQLDGEVATEISDDGTGERRRRSFEAIEERALTLNGRMTVGAGANGGTAVRVVLPRYAAESERSD